MKKSGGSTVTTNIGESLSLKGGIARGLHTTRRKERDNYEKVSKGVGGRRRGAREVGEGSSKREQGRVFKGTPKGSRQSSGSDGAASVREEDD